MTKIFCSYMEGGLPKVKEFSKMKEAKAFCNELQKEKKRYSLYEQINFKWIRVDCFSTN